MDEEPYARFLHARGLAGKGWWVAPRSGHIESYRVILYHIGATVLYKGSYKRTCARFLHARVLAGKGW